MARQSLSTAQAAHSGFVPPLVPPLELEELEELLELEDDELLELELLVEAVAVVVPELELLELEDDELLELDEEEELLELEEEELLELADTGQTQLPETESQARAAAVHTRSSAVQSAAVLQTWLSRSQ